MPSQASEQSLVAAWNKIANDLGLDASQGRETLLETARDYSLLSAGRLEPEMGGGWQWNLTEGAVRTICATCLLVGVLAAAGMSGLAPLVLPSVLPLLFDIDKVRLERSEGKVLRILGARPDLKQRLGDAAALYESLPAEIRGSFSLDAFEDFLATATRAGVVRDWDGIFEVLPNGETVFKISLR